MATENKKMKISYPCPWSYKIIGPDKDLVKEAITTIFTPKEYSLRYANASRTGKYHSWSVTLKVESEGERNTLFRELKNHPNIRMVI